LRALFLAPGANLVYYSCFAVVWGWSIMNELGGVLQRARVVVVGRMHKHLPCLALAGLLACSFTSSWATPGDNNGEPRVVVPAATAASDSALIGAIKDLASNGSALDQLIEFDATTLQQLYAARSYEPIWVGSAGMQPQGETLLAALERLQRSGALPPDADVAAASAHRGDTTTAGLTQGRQPGRSARARAGSAGLWGGCRRRR
jgi:hypothetical protein